MRSCCHSSVILSIVSVTKMFLGSVSGHCLVKNDLHWVVIGKTSILIFMRNIFKVKMLIKPE